MILTVARPFSQSVLLFHGQLSWRWRIKNHYPQNEIKFLEQASAGGPKQLRPQELIFVLIDNMPSLLLEQCLQPASSNSNTQKEMEKVSSAWTCNSTNNQWEEIFPMSFWDIRCLSPITHFIPSLTFKHLNMCMYDYDPLSGIDKIDFCELPYTPDSIMCSEFFFVFFL